MRDITLSHNGTLGGSRASGKASSKGLTLPNPSFIQLFHNATLITIFSPEAGNGKIKGKNFKLVYGRFYFILEC
jgi:hypothetical protein